jgi:hypothetical protein
VADEPVADSTAVSDHRAVAEDRAVARREVVERPPWSPAQLVALVIGIIFAVIGGIALSNTGVHSNADAWRVVNTDGPLWNHTAWMALGELLFGLCMIGAGVVPGGARGFMTFLGILALAAGIAVLIAPADLLADEGTGWWYIVAGGVTLLAAAVSPVFFAGERRTGYSRRREVTA